jgi:hypothetical protein
VTAALFLLVRYRYLGSEVFVCPSSNAEKDTLNGKPAIVRCNFSNSNNLSYSIATPYPDPLSIQLGYRFSPAAPANLAIAADRNDGEQLLSVTSGSPASEQRRINSKNHKSDGQNVLFNDGHCVWSASAWVGADRDCIYSYALTTNAMYLIGGVQLDPAQSRSWPDGFMSPALALDTLLIPCKGVKTGWP